jgi:hypothetical protein
LDAAPVIYTVEQIPLYAAAVVAEIVALSREVIDRATEIRAQYGV